MSDVDHRTEPKRPEQSLGELIAEMTRELGDLFRQEVELARVETRTELNRAGKAGAMMAAGAVAALLTLTLASFALAELLDQGLNRALSFAIVAVLWAIVAAVAISIGRRKMREVRPLPETTRSLQEDKEWAKNLTS